MNILEETAKILLGVVITGIISAIVWLFKWVDQVRLDLRDIGRDIKHLQRQNLTTSAMVAKLDIQDEEIEVSVRNDLISIDRRIARAETRVYVLETRLSDGLTQALARFKDAPPDSEKSP